MKAIFTFIIIGSLMLAILLFLEIYEDTHKDKLTKIEKIEFPVIVLFEYKDSWALQELIILKDNNGDSCFVRNEKIAKLFSVGDTIPQVYKQLIK